MFFLTATLKKQNKINKNTTIRSSWNKVIAMLPLNFHSNMKAYNDETPQLRKKYKCCNITEPQKADKKTAEQILFKEALSGQQKQTKIIWSFWKSCILFKGRKKSQRFENNKKIPRKLKKKVPKGICGKKSCLVLQEKSDESRKLFSRTSKISKEVFFLKNTPHATSSQF